MSRSPTEVGVLRERAQRMVNLIDASKVPALEDGTELLLKRTATRGVTVIHDVVTTSTEIKAYQNLMEQGRLPVRVQLLVRIIESDITTKSMIELGYRQPFGKTMRDEGFPIAFGSDATAYWPVDSIRDIAAMVNRRTFQGTLMEPQEAISFRDGIRAETKDAAWVGFEEKRAGTLEVGKIADVCVFDEDPDAVDPMRLYTLPVKYTICAGKITYQA